MESVEIIVGDTVVEELHCPQVGGPPPECTTTEILPWVMETEAFAPGRLWIEVIATDTDQESSSERFWVDIPKPSPPTAGAPSPPRFQQIKEFREAHGLEIVFPVANAIERNERIFNLIKAWHEPTTPAGQVARASWERWGVPLRPADVAELDYRIAYWSHAAEAVPAWASTHAPGTYASVYLDERAGGKIVVGFTASQESQVEELRNSGIVPPDRLVEMQPVPLHSLASLEGLEEQIGTAALGYPPGLITNRSVDVPSNSVRVGASNVAQAETLLDGSFGQQAPISTYFLQSRRELKVGRERIGGMVRAGDEILQRYPGGGVGPCTASFGAFERGRKPGNGQPVLRLFALTAGHCEEVGERVWRRSDPNPTPAEKQDIGFVRRSGYETPGDAAVDVDAAAIKLASDNFVPRKIFQAEGSPLIDVTSIWSPAVGTNLCFSGRTSKNRIRCGPVLAPPGLEYWEGGGVNMEQCFKQYIWGGDSGSPVWVEGTGVAVGIATSSYGGPGEPGLTPQESAEAVNEPEEACITLLRPYPGRNPAATVFGSPDIGSLHLVTRSNANP